MLNNLDKEDLRKRVEEILMQLIDSRLINVKKDEIPGIVNRVTETLTKDPSIVLTKDDLKEKETSQAIGLACIAEINPEHKLKYTKLFDKNLDLHPELKVKLNSIFDKMLQFNKELKLTPEQRSTMRDKIEELAELLERKLHKEDKAELTKYIMALDILEQQAQARIMSYGVDTHHPGAVLTVVQAVVAGNQMGFQDLATFGDNFMAKLNDPNLGVEDPIGVRATAVLFALADGMINTESEKSMLQLLNNVHIPLYDTPTLKAQ